jgi:hypothetical protein
MITQITLSRCRKSLARWASYYYLGLRNMADFLPKISNYCSGAYMALVVGNRIFARIKANHRCKATPLQSNVKAPATGEKAHK